MWMHYGPIQNLLLMFLWAYLWPHALQQHLENFTLGPWSLKGRCCTNRRCQILKTSAWNTLQPAHPLTSSLNCLHQLHLHTQAQPPGLHENPDHTLYQQHTSGKITPASRSLHHLQQAQEKERYDGKSNNGQVFGKDVHNPNSVSGAFHINSYPLHTFLKLVSLLPHRFP